MKVGIKLTVLFDGTFWVGIFERTYEESYEISKVVFGSEPKDYEVYDFISKNLSNLRFSNSLAIDRVEERKINPKRLQREIRKETEVKEIGTKAQLALKLQYEANKAERRVISREEKKEEKEKQFQLRQEKKKEKHKGH